MTEAELPALLRQILWAAFALSALFGAVAQRTHFCTMGAIGDIVNMGDWTRMRMWLLAIGIAVIGFNAMVAMGWLQAADSIYGTPRVNVLSLPLGGVMFGFGMVLASGCGSKTLVRIGGGNLKSLVVFFVLGIAAYATLRGITGVLRVATVDTVFVTLPTGQDLPSLLAHYSGFSRQLFAAWAGALIGLAIVGFALSRREGRAAEVLLGGIVVGAAVVAMWWVSGRLGHLAEHPVTLESVFLATNSQRMESMSFVAPMAYTLDWLILFSDTSRVLSIGIVSAAGMVVGSAAVALTTRRFRWEGFAGVEDTANHLVGATLMGVGGVTASGCTIGQGLSGVSTLSIGSALALAGIVGGAVAALKYQIWRMERMA